MSPRGYGFLVAAWILAAVVAVAWSASRREPVTLRAAEAPPVLGPGRRAPASYETEDTLPSALRDVAAEPVRGEWADSGGRAVYVALRSRRDSDFRYEQIGRRTFYLPLRLSEPDLTQYPCTSCHGGQGPVDGRTEEETDRVHQNIRPVHPRQTGAQCLTCHAADDVSTLQLERGGTTSLDHAYLLCAQCHAPQVESWAHGVHGKPLVGWRGRRVIMGCADCHDPHRPATEKRIPMAGFELPGHAPSEHEAGEREQEGVPHE